MKKITDKIIISVLLLFFAVLISFSTLNAQDTKFRAKALRVGLIGGLNYNAVSLGWQQLHQNRTTGLWEDNFHSEPLHIDRVDGNGWGGFGGIFGEYLSSSWWGIQFRIAYDERYGLVNDDTRTPNPSFDTRMSYNSNQPLE